MTVNNNAGPCGFCNWNEKKVKDISSNNWRASLVPAAAVIPAPIAYIKVVAVKKLVVEPRTRGGCLPRGRTLIHLSRRDLFHVKVKGNPVLL